MHSGCLPIVSPQLRAVPYKGRNSPHISPNSAYLSDAVFMSVVLWAEKSLLLDAYLEENKSSLNS